MTTKVHLISQGKGGVGKTLIAVMLAQYFQEKGKNVVAIDTDPVNATLNKFTGLSPTYIEILDESDQINERNFDNLIEKIISINANADKKEDTIIIIDSGASSFVPLAGYLKDNNVTQFLTDNKIDVITHSVITGGQAMVDTLNGFQTLAKTDALIYVWKNEYFGKIEKKGKTFEQSNVYTTYKDQVLGIIEIKRKKAYVNVDIEEMLQNHLTFNEAIDSTDFTAMSRQRLKILRGEIFKSITDSGI